MKSKIILTERDIKIFRFLWRWKLLTTRAIHAKFFSKAGLLKAYNRLKELEQKKYIRSHIFSYEEGQVWCLDLKGFKAIASEMDGLKEIGFRSEHLRHDFFVSAIHLGEWLADKPENVFICSEQELRRVDPQFLPSWLPQSNLHRPDGFWLFQGPTWQQIISLEIETHRKVEDEIKRVKTYYDSQENIGLCLWFVKSESFAKLLYDKLSSDSTSKNSVHQFFLLKDFCKVGWNSPCIGGSLKGRTVTEIFNSYIDKKVGVTKPYQRGVCQFFTYLLDCRKRPINSPSSKIPHPHPTR